jgi:hypothetical protein
MRNHPTVLPFAEHAETPPGFGENDFSRCDFHDRKHEVNQLEVEYEDQKSHQNPGEINKIQEFSPDSPNNDLVIDAKN